MDTNKGEKMDEKTLKNVQNRQRIILEYFINFCERNNLKYYLVGGTCLGAIRHNDFIPWDDDIDVGMPRCDYEKFMKLYNNEDEKYFLQSFKTERAYYQHFSKLRDPETVYIEESSKHLDINHGIFIDIFPLESANNLSYDYHYYNVIYYLTKLNILVRNPEAKLTGTSLNLVKSISKLERGLLVSLINWLCNRKKCESPKYYICIDTKPLKRKYLLVEDYDYNFKADFGNLKANIPREYDKYLSALYGDYMKLPPEEERLKGHGIIEVKF